MVRYRVGPLGVADLLYASATVPAVLFATLDSGVSGGMAVLAVLVLLVDWGRARRVEADNTGSFREVVGFVVFSVPVLVTWVGLATRSPATLELFFALLAAFFFLTAVRDAVLLELTPVELLLEGYASLVAVYLVLGATADALSEYEGALVVIAVGVFVVRNLFHWTATLLGLLAGDTSSRS